MKTEIAPTEIWKPICGHEGFYEVSNFGRVRSLKFRNTAGRILRTAKQRSGHLRVDLGRRQRNRLVHRLVIETFVGPRPEGMECCHHNGDPEDNRIENLRWDTRSSNHADKRIHGTSRSGEENPFSKLKADEVKDIRRMRSSGFTLKDIAEAFGVTQSTVSAIARRKAWAHINYEDMRL